MPGVGVNQIDIAPRFAGVLMGITNTAGTIPGIIAPIIAKTIAQKVKKCFYHCMYFSDDAYQSLNNHLFSYCSGLCC